MRILYDGRILDNPAPSGVGLYARSLLDGISRLPGVELKVFTNSYKDAPHSSAGSLPAGVNEYRTRYPNKLLTLSWSLGNVPSAARVFADADLILCPHISVLTRAPVPKIVTIHDLSFEHFPQFHRPRERFWHQLAARSARTADHIIAVSHATKEDILKTWGIPSRQVHVIYPGAPDLSQVEATPFEALTSQLHIQKPYLLAVGTLEPRKNLVRLVRSFALLKQQAEHRDLALVLAGARGSDYPNIKREITKSGLEASVIITGYLSENEKKALYQSASLFVYPSIYEGFGFPLLEAMQMGVPVIASRTSSIPEVTGQAAVLIDPYDTSELADALAVSLTDQVLRDRCSALGYEQFQKFSWSSCADAVRALCQELS